MKTVKNKSLYQFFIDYLGYTKDLLRNSCDLPRINNDQLIPADKFNIGDVWSFEFVSSTRLSENVEIVKEFKVVEYDSVNHRFEEVKKSVEFTDKIDY